MNVKDLPLSIRASQTNDVKFVSCPINRVYNFWTKNHSSSRYPIPIQCFIFCFGKTRFFPLVLQIWCSYPCCRKTNSKELTCRTANRNYPPPPASPASTLCLLSPLFPAAMLSYRRDVAGHDRSPRSSALRNRPPPLPRNGVEHMVIYI